MAPPAASAERMREARIRFYGYLGGSLAALVAIHLMVPAFRDDEFVRMVLTVLWFTCATSITWSLTEPCTTYLRALYQWRYSESGPAINFTAGKLLIRQSRFLTGLGWIMTLALTACALYVFSHWSYGSPFAPVREPLRWGWIGLTAAMPLYVAAMAGTLKEAHQLRRELTEQAELAGISVKTDFDAAEDAKAAQAEPVTITGRLTFKAGGHDWHFADFYKNAAVFGMSGSGKTVCVLNALLDGLIGSGSGSGKPCAGLVLDPKGDFRTKIGTVCRKYGRGRDLVIIDPYDLRLSARFNPLDSPDDPIEIAGRFAGVMETLNQRSGEDAYWIDSCRKFIQYMIPLLREAKQDAPPDLIDIHDCATDDEVLLGMLDRIPESRLSAKAVKRAFDYVLNEWHPMDAKPKSTIRSFLTNMLAPFLQEPYDDLFAGRSTKSMGEILDEGRILYVYMPIADKEAMARVVSTFVKLEFYREVLKRIDKDRPSFFLCDEFQAFFTVGAGRGDAEAFDKTRQSNHASIVAFQNLPALLRQAPKDDVVMNLLGNCATKIFLRNTDRKTNEYASTLFGERIETLVGTGQSIAGMRGGSASRSLSAQAQYAKRVREDVFPALAVPSREEGVGYAEAMVHMAARARVDQARQRWKVHPLKDG